MRARARRAGSIRPAVRSPVAYVFGQGAGHVSLGQGLYVVVVHGGRSRVVTLLSWPGSIAALQNPWRGLPRTALVLGSLLQSAGSTVPQHSPKPTRAAPGFSHQPRITTASPSSRNTRCSPPGNCHGVLAASGQLNQCPGLIERGARQVPLPSKSPGCRLQPLTVWVRQHLGNGPVRVAVAGAADGGIALPGLRHARRAQAHLQLNVESRRAPGWRVSRGKAVGPGRPQAG